MDKQKLTSKEFLALPIKERRRLLTEQANDPGIIKYYQDIILDEQALQDRCFGMMD